MKNYQLHYASIELNTEIEDIPVFEFKKHKEMIDFIDDNCLGKKDVVFLIAQKENSNVFISHSHLSIQCFLQKQYLWNTIGTYYLQEYDSFESAYAVALMIAEESELCYSPKKV